MLRNWHIINSAEHINTSLMTGTQATMHEIDVYMAC